MKNGMPLPQLTPLSKDAVMMLVKAILVLLKRLWQLQMIME